MRLNKAIHNSTFLLLAVLLCSCSQAYKPYPKSYYLIEKHSNIPIPKNKPKKGLLLGVYSPDYLGIKGNVKRQLLDLERWSGKKHSIAGIFIDLETHNPHYDIPAQAELLYEYGFTPLFNLTSSRTTQEIIDGKINSNIYEMGAAFKNLLDANPNLKIMVAPLPEMNGFWEAYGESPEGFIMAYHQIRDLFFQAGVPRDAVYWVFSPNGWSNKGHEFERYFPGDESTDAVAYSSYNFGFCDTTDWPKWQSAKELHAQYIDRFKNLTSLPIIVGQTASTAETQQGYDLVAKNQWLKENYEYLATAGNVMGIMYFNLQKECDWAVHTGGTRGVEGYREAIKHPGITYVSPRDINIFFKR